MPLVDPRRLRGGDATARAGFVYLMHFKLSVEDAVPVATARKL